MAQDHSDKAVPRPADDERHSGVAPSKPSLPTTGSVERVPEPIEGDDADIIAPVEQPTADEVMPPSGSNPWHPTMESDTRAADGDALRELGDSAVRSASLSASGAPTPLGGVPQVTSFEPEKNTGAVRPAWVAGDPKGDAPSSATQWSLRTPADATPETPASPVSPSSAPSTDSAPTPDHPDETAALPAAPTFGDTSAPYTPRVSAASAATAPSDGDVPGPPVTTTAEPPRTPWYASTVFLVAVGLIVLGGIGYGVYLAMFAPGDVELTPEVLVEAPAAATVDPIALDDPTPFLAAMPATVGTYAMTAATPVDPEEADLTVEPAEVNTLTYSDGTDEFTLRAIQHFTEEDATEQYATLAGGGDNAEPVTVGDAEVGEKVTLGGDPEIYVWRNGTAVFELTGPAAQIESFYEQFPL